MKIRAQSIISIIIFGIALLLISASFIYESQQLERRDLKFSSLSEDISNLAADGPDQQALIDNIKADRQQLKAVTASKADLEKEVAERKRAEKELIEAKMQAELYLDLMSHDINNLHQIALGYLELSKEIQAEGARSDYIDKPIEVLQRSSLLIKNVRKLQKLKDGLFPLEKVDVRAVLDHVRSEPGSVPDKAVSMNFNGNGHCYVMANELLYDVFANLVSNAIKHTGDRADIAVNLDIINHNGGRYCQVVVEDGGPGIPDDFKVTVFNRALKGSARAKGLGLGLYLVKSLVDSYGGKVWVEDRVPGDHAKGAKFVVLLPAAE